MADPTTPNKGLFVPARNADINTWDIPVNANWNALDAILGGTTTIPLSNQPVALTQAQAQNASLIFIGAITADIVVALPAGFGGIFSVLNGTTSASGNRVIFETATGGAAVSLPPGLRKMVLSDGNNVYFAEQGFPPGTPIPWLSNNFPGGFIAGYGQVLNRTDQPGIFAAYGTTFNTGGEAATQFRMPDLRGVTFAGIDNMGGVARGLLTAFGSGGQQLGAVGGEQSHTLLTAEMPTHGHAVNDNGHSHGLTDPGHKHPYIATSVTNQGTTGGSGLVNAGTQAGTTDTATTGISIVAATTGVSIQTTGGGTAHNNVQPTMLCNWIIKT